MIVQELVAKLGLNVDEQAFSRVDAVMHMLGKGLIGVGAAFGAAAVGIAAVVNSAANAADEFDEASQKAGTSAETLQRLAYAGQFSSLKLGDVTQMLIMLSRQSVAAADGSDELRAAFARVGISGAALKTMAPEEKLARIADALKAMGNDPGRPALVMKLLGRSGAQAIPMLSQGADALRELMAEAPVMSDEAIKAGAAFKDEQDRLAFSAAGLRNVIGAGLFPVFTQLTKTLRDGAGWLTKFAAPKVVATVNKLAAAIKWLHKNSVILTGALGTLVALKLGALIAAGTALTAVEIQWGLAAMVAGARAYAAGLLAAAGGAAATVGWAALLVLLWLVIDDLYYFFTDGESLIGKFGAKWTAFLDDFLREENDDWWITRKIKSAIRYLLDLQKAYLDVKQFFWEWGRQGLPDRSTQTEDSSPTLNAWLGQSLADPMASFGGGVNPAASAAWSSNPGRAVNASRFHVEQTIVAQPGQSAAEVGRAAADAFDEWLQGELQQTIPAVDQ